MVEAKIGDVIVCCGVEAEIGEIISQYTDDEFLAVEFIDTHGMYRYWKQRFDGGRIIRK